MISLHYTSHTKAYNTYYAQCDIVEQSTPLHTSPMRFLSCKRPPASPRAHIGASSKDPTGGLPSPRPFGGVPGDASIKKTLGQGYLFAPAKILAFHCWPRQASEVKSSSLYYWRVTSAQSSNKKR